MGRLIGILLLIAFIVWIVRGPYLQWRQRQKFRQFESEQRRKWEGHKRE